jgi:Holliday junction DNA helicase RuvA
VRIIGVDPGLRRAGWGVVDLDRGRLRHVANGVCDSGDGPMGGRLARLHAGLAAVIARHAPDAAALERTFVNADPSGALSLGQARGVALLALAQAGLDVAEFAPNEVKKAIVGVGARRRRRWPPWSPSFCRACAPRPMTPGTRWPSRSAAPIAHARRRHEGAPMIGKLTGRVDHIAEDHALLDVGGVGYVVFCAPQTLRALAPGEAAALYTELIVREDSLTLYGFASRAEREWHRLLTSVQGVGPRLGVAILGALGPETVAQALARGDAATIKAAPGVGPKLAARIVSELRDKAPSVMAMAGASPSAARTVAAPSAAPGGADGRAAVAADALSALTHLGYGDSEAAQAVAEAAAEGAEDAAALIRAALKLLAPKG